ncbi:hypothetical protein HKD37_04G011288 [Glycine soja]
MITGFFNKTLLVKWKWTFFHNNHSLWGQVNESRYGGRGLVERSVEKKSSICWRDLKRICGEESEDKWVDKMRALFINRFPAKDNLKKKNIVMHRNHYKCVFCEDNEESADHVFLNCRKILPLIMEKCFN